MIAFTNDHYHHKGCQRGRDKNHSSRANPYGGEGPDIAMRGVGCRDQRLIIKQSLIGQSISIFVRIAINDQLKIYIFERNLVVGTMQKNQFISSLNDY